MFTQRRLPEWLKPVLPPGDKKSLVVLIEPHPEDTTVVSRDDLLAVIKEREAQDWFINEEDINLLLVEQTQAFRESKGYCIAEARHSRVDIEIPPDRLQAWLTLTRPYGGESATRSTLVDALTQAGVKHGILDF